MEIGKRLVRELKPRFLRIGGYWYPRGGIPIDVFWQTGKLPKGLWLPDQGVAPYRGRGLTQTVTLAFGELIERHQRLDQAFEFVERHHVGAVRRCVIGIGMGLDEHASHSDGHRGTRQHRDELRSPPDEAPWPPGC